MRNFASPSRYIQGENALFENAKPILELGSHPVLLCDSVVYDIVGERFEKYLLRYGFTVLPVFFNGEASDNEINRVVSLAEENGCDLVIGLGGGKTIDSAKAIADLLKSPVVIAPTIASTDAPVSALSVIYTDEGAFARYIFYSKNPELVLVDSKVISQAPKRLLASGIADGLATWVEARAVMQANGKTMLGKHQTLAGVAIAQRCEEILFADNGFTALTGDIHHLTHGEKVAYGTLVQLFLENRPKEELNKYIHFYQQIGMPTTLKEMHLENASYEDLLKVGQQATIEGETIHQMPFKVQASDIAQAIVAVDAYVKSLG